MQPDPPMIPLTHPSSLEKISPPKDLSKSQKLVFFDYFFRELAAFRNTALAYAETEAQHEAAAVKEARTSNMSPSLRAWQVQFGASLNAWAQGLARSAWVVCSEESEGVSQCSIICERMQTVGGPFNAEKCPILEPFDETSTCTQDLLLELPSKDDISHLVNTILFLHITTAKGYPARTRAFLACLQKQLNPCKSARCSPSVDLEPGTPQASMTDCPAADGDDAPFEVDEEAIAWTLKNPDTAIEQAQKQAEAVTAQHAERSKVLRDVGVSLGAIAGGVLVGITGGLAAPLVGAGVATILGWLGVGGTILGLLASGLAGSGVVCAALFGVYGAQSTAAMVERHTREVRDLAIVPVKRVNGTGNGDGSGGTVSVEKKAGIVRDTLGVRLCVSGWLNGRKDVTEPWTVFDGDDTFALQWVRFPGFPEGLRAHVASSAGN